MLFFTVNLSEICKTKNVWQSQLPFFIVNFTDFFVFIL